MENCCGGPRLDSAVQASPVVMNGRAYVVSESGTAYALFLHQPEPESHPEGELIWRYETRDYVASKPVLANGVVYFGSYDRHLYALDATSSKFLWRYEIGRYLRSSPTVANDVVYIGSNEGYVYALDAVTGSLHWRYLTEGEISGSPSYR